MYKTTIKIEGMISKMCEFHIRRAIKRVIVPVKIKTAYSLGTAIVYTEEQIDQEALTEAIDKTGYVVKEITSKEVYSKNDLIDFFKRLTSKKDTE